MTGIEIDTPDTSLSQQFGAINIGIKNRLSLLLNLRSSADGKLKGIFEILSQPTLTDNHKEVLIKLIEACKHKKYTRTRIGTFIRKVLKTSLT